MPSVMTKAGLPFPPCLYKSAGSNVAVQELASQNATIVIPPVTIVTSVCQVDVNNLNPSF